LDQRMEYLEKVIGESADHQKNTKSTLESRLDGIERSLDSKGHKSEIEKLEATILSDIDKRLTAIEQKHLQDFIKRLNTYETNHMQEFTDMKRRLGDIDRALSECAKIEHYVGMDKKHEGLKGYLSTEAETARAKLGELQAKVSANEGTLDVVQRKLADSQHGLGLKVSTIEASNSRFKTMFEELDAAMRLERSDRESGASKSDERISRLEGMVQGSLGSCLKDIDVTKGKISDCMGRIEAQRANLDNFKVTVDVRLGQMDASMAESIQGNDLIRELDQRLVYLQEDQKRARDMLESSLAEKIKLEHSAVHSQSYQIKEQWDREVKARQAYQENYQELLGQERFARESQETIIDRRLETFERSLYGEIQRLWQEMGREVPSQVIQQYVTSPRVSQYVAPTSPRVSRYVAPTQATVARLQAGPMTGMAYAPSVEAYNMPASVTLPAAINAPASPMLTRQYSTGTISYRA